MESQKIGQLSTPRLTPNPAFATNGIDFAGSFTLNKGHSRKPVLIKSYSSLYVCFSTKVTHLKVVSDISTDAFLAALKRFIFRRSQPTEVYSDCGSNFKSAASNKLKTLYQFLSTDSTQRDIRNYLLSHQTNGPSIPRELHILEA